MKCLSLDDMVGEILVVDSKAGFISFSNLNDGEYIRLPNGTPLTIYGWRPQGICSWRPQGRSVIVNLLDLSCHRKVFDIYHDQDFAARWIEFNTKVQRGVQ